MAKELDAVQAAHKNWMAALQLYKEELAKTMGGCEYNSTKLKKLSDEARECNDKFLAAIKQRNSASDGA